MSDIRMGYLTTAGHVLAAWTFLRSTEVEIVLKEGAALDFLRK